MKKLTQGEAGVMQDVNVGVSGSKAIAFNHWALFQENRGGRNVVPVNEVNMAKWGLASAITREGVASGWLGLPQAWFSGAAEVTQETLGSQQLSAVEEALGTRVSGEKQSLCHIHGLLSILA